MAKNLKNIRDSFLVLKYNFDIYIWISVSTSENKVFQYTITLFMLFHIFSEKVVE